MRKLIIAIACLLLTAFLNAQQITSFPAEHDGYMKALEKYMTNGKLEANVKLMEEFSKMVKDGKISSGWLDKMISTSDLMIERNMSPYPHFNNYITAVMNASKTGKTDEQFDDWCTIVEDIIPNQKKGENGDFIKFIEFSSGFFTEKALNITPAKTWRVETDQYKLGYEDNKPTVTFPVTTLKGYIRGDTISIKQTAGQYFPLESKWTGKSGRVDWGRVGLDPSKVFCTFGEYAINTSNFNYTIDTVIFTNSDYFKQPLRGKLTDKMQSSADTINMTYPRFESYDIGMTIKNFAPNVSYTGGFSLHGSKVLGYGTAENRAELDFYAKDGKTKLLTARSQSVTIRKGEELGADKAEVSIYFGTDSIYHPQLTLIYKIPKKEMRLLRGETGIGQAKFNDSYHNDEFTTDAIFWNLDSTVLNLKILSGVGKKPGVYESTNYFNKELLRKTQGLASYEPLSILKKMTEQNGSRDINATDFARKLDPNMKEGEVKSLLYDLLSNGFILYNEDLGVITLKDKAINYVLAKARKIDYDIITIKSAPHSGNDNIDLKNSNINLKGVFEVPISDTAYVYFRPKDNSMSLQKDRNMLFDGLVFAGRMDMMGEKFHFQYAPFTVELNKVDTMRINVPDSGKIDKYGEPVLKPMKSKVEGIKGLLEIDAPINKSGRTRLPQFPKLYSREKSYIYYDDSAVAKGAYGRKNFFFELDPFRLDSLNNFSPDIIAWQGRLVSGGIFPDIKDSVHIQKDESLGFKSQTPPGGFDLYKGKGKYYGKYELNYSGIQGDGRITHSTADFTTHDVRLYPDSMLGNSDTFRIAKTFDGVKTPTVFGTQDYVLWRPGADSMHVSMKSNEHPFAMYDDTLTSFRGSLLLTGKGLRGNGTLDWDQATLSSKDISLRTMALGADTSSLNIKTTGDRVSFKTPNVNAKVDFETRIGDFVSNLKDIPTDFIYNQYNTAINQFKWFMDEKILDFKVPADGPSAYFNSTRPDQKGLRFLGRRAIYYLVSSVLRIEQVKEIRVADAIVSPDSGLVIIEGEAKMHQFRNAIIYADTFHRFHEFDSCVVDIYSKEELKAIGNYHYNTKGINEIISFGDISTKKTTEGKNRKAHDLWNLVAKTTIDEKQGFVLYPKVSYYGDASILASERVITFKGYAKLGFTDPKALTSEFLINQDVTPMYLALNYNDSTVDKNNNHLSAGIHISPLPDAPQLYTTLLAPKKDYKDITLFNTKGIVAQLATGEYAFGSEKRIRDNIKPGNILIYDTAKRTVMAEGKVTLGANFGLIKTAAAGSAEVKLDSGKYKINMDLAIDAQMNDKMQERFEFYMAGDNADQPDIAYDKTKQKKAVYNLADEEEDKKLLSDFEQTNAFVKRPKAIKENLVFTDVNFVFDPDDISLRSVGKIGVAMIGKKVINKKLEGYIEIQYKGGNDVFTIYLQTGTKGWIYFEYRPGDLGILSSYDDINNNLKALAVDKRKIKGSGKAFYLYSAASAGDEQDFVAYMKDKAAGVNRPHPTPREPIEELPAGADTSSIPENTPPPADTLNKQEKQEQDQINEINQMKENGGSILSGPPPGKKQDAAPVDTTAQPKKDAAPAPVNPNDIPQNTPPATPKQDSAAVVPVDIPKKDTVPVAPVTAPEQPKQDAAPSVPQTVPDVPKKDTVPSTPQVVPDVPKSEAAPPVQPSTPEVKKDTVTSTPVVTPDVPKTDAGTTAPQVVPTVPKTDSIPVTPPVVPDIPKSDTTGGQPH